MLKHDLVMYCTIQLFAIFPDSKKGLDLLICAGGTMVLSVL